MPIYEYRCKACGHAFERIQRFSDRPLRKCPECAGALEKLVSVSAFQLKGGGWFASDYSRSAASASGDSKEKSGEKTPGGGTKDAGGKSSCGAGGCGCAH